MAENLEGQNIVTNPTSKQSGFDLPRQIINLGDSESLAERSEKEQSHDVLMKTTYKLLPGTVETMPKQSLI